MIQCNASLSIPDEHSSTYNTYILHANKTNLKSSTFCRVHFCVFCLLMSTQKYFAFLAAAIPFRLRPEINCYTSIWKVYSCRHRWKWNKTLSLNNDNTFAACIEGFLNFCIGQSKGILETKSFLLLGLFRELCFYIIFSRIRTLSARFGRISSWASVAQSFSTRKDEDEGVISHLLGILQSLLRHLITIFSVFFCCCSFANGLPARVPYEWKAQT